MTGGWRDKDTREQTFSTNPRGEEPTQSDIIVKSTYFEGVGMVMGTITSPNGICLFGFPRFVYQSRTK